MHKFMEALLSEEKHHDIPEEFDFFGKLIGSWKIDYIDMHTSHVRKGEWHFSRILDGMAIQDVITLPGYECGTTIRLYHPEMKFWDVAYCYSDKIMRFQAKKQEGKIVLTNIGDENRKWVFVNIEKSNFHWQDIYVNEDGEWEVNYDLYAKRM